MGFIGVEVEQETSATPPKKNPGSAPGPGGLSVRRDLDLAITSRSCFRCRNGYTCNSVWMYVTNKSGWSGVDIVKILKKQFCVWLLRPTLTRAVQINRISYIFDSESVCHVVYDEFSVARYRRSKKSLRICFENFFFWTKIKNKNKWNRTYPSLMRFTRDTFFSGNNLFDQVCFFFSIDRIFYSFKIRIHNSPCTYKFPKGRTCKK